MCQSNNPTVNAEGYSDPTAHQAMVNQDYQEIKDMLKFIREYAAMKGYRIENRVEFRQLATGKLFK